MTDYTQLPSRDIERLARPINPGEWACDRARPISTLLGSCVAVCLYDSGIPIAGMNHFMLPQMNKNRANDDDILLAGDACMEALLNGLLAQGAARHRIRAKAFGGGTIIESTGQSLSIGKRNADFAREWLDRENIPLVSSDLLGPWSRKVLLVPQNGEALCKRITINAQSAEHLKREEKAYAASLNTPQSNVAGGEKRIELF